MRKKKLHIILAFTLKHDSHANMSKDGDDQFFIDIDGIIETP